MNLTGRKADWKKGRYVYAVSAIIAFIHDIDEYLKEAYELNEDLNRVIAE